jgi:hypothetical protein
MMVPDLMKRFLPQPGRAMERRLHKRAVLYWWHARGERDVAVLADFDPLEIEDDFSHGFLLDLRAADDPVFTYIGPVLAQEAGVEGDRVHLASVPETSLLMRFASHRARALASGQPETAEYDFVTFAGYHVLCRGALLPLSADGVTLDHVYGVVSWKSEKVANQAT